MRHKKLLFTSLMATLAMAVLLNAASALASGETVICKVQETPCSKSNTRPAGSYFYGWVEPYTVEEGKSKFELKGKTDTVACDLVVLGAQTTAESGSPLSAKGEKILDPSKCHFFNGGKVGTTCEKTSLTLPATASVFSSLGGIVTLGSEAQPVSISVTCAFGLTCTYGGAVNMFFNATKHTLVISQTLKYQGGVFEGYCGSTATLNATFGDVGDYIRTN